MSKSAELEKPWSKSTLEREGKTSFVSVSVSSCSEEESRIQQSYRKWIHKQILSNNSNAKSFTTDLGKPSSNTRVIEPLRVKFKRSGLILFPLADSVSNQVSVLCLAAQLYLTLLDKIDCRPPGYSVRGILQARILEWVAMPSSQGSFQPRFDPSSFAGIFFTVWALREATSTSRH